jgi:hypothetical protein
VQEVRVFAESVTIRDNVVFISLSFLVCILPFVPIVTAFGVLQLVQQLLVFIDYFSQIFDPVRSV